MFDLLISPISPHICKGCGKAEKTLCNSCFFNIVEEKYAMCISCNGIADSDGMCCDCKISLPFDRAFVVGPRTHALKKVVGDFKYNSERAAADIIAKLLDQTLPVLPSDVLIVPIPTIAPHIRQRGFGHTELVARKLARRRKMRSTTRLLVRNESSVQHGLRARDRHEQAARAFRIGKFNVPHEVLLIDDIYTTGATLSAAAELLKLAGVKVVNVAVVARHIKE